MPPAKKQPKRELRVSRIQIVVMADVLEDGRKVDEAAIGPSDENGVRPYTLFDIDAVTDWAAAFRVQLATMTPPEASQNGH